MKVTSSRSVMQSVARVRVPNDRQLSAFAGETRERPKALKLLHIIQDSGESGRAMQNAPLAGTGFFCCSSTGPGINVAGAVRSQATDDPRDDMTHPEKHTQVSRITRGLRPECVQPDRETPVVNQLTRIYNELLNAKRQLEKKHAQLQKVSTEKSQVLGMVAHDLRNPLCGILNATEYVLQDAACLLGENDLTLLQAIESTSRLLLRVIDNMVEVSAIESGK